MEERFCPQCGAPIEDGAVKCRFCETPIVEGEVIPPDRSYVQQNDGYNQYDAYEQEAGYDQNSDYNQYEVYGQDNKNNKASDVSCVYGVLAYLNLLVLIPILAVPDSHFARFHSNQGLILLIAQVVLAILGGIFGNIWLFEIIINVATLFITVLRLIGIITAIQGKEKELPIIGHIKLLDR